MLHICEFLLFCVIKNPSADLKFLFGVHCDASKVQNLIRLLVEKVWPKSADGKPSTDHMDIMKRLLEYKSFALCINAFCKSYTSVFNN